MNKNTKRFVLFYSGSDDGPFQSDSLTIGRIWLCVGNDNGPALMMHYKSKVKIRKGMMLAAYHVELFKLFPFK